MHARRRAVGALLGTVALLLGWLPAAPPVHANTIVVNSLADPNPAVGSCPVTCTLRNALSAAQNGDTIRIDAIGTILLSGALTISRSVTIQGPGAARLIVDGQAAVRVFSVSSGVQATFDGITVQGGVTSGTSAGGAGIRNNGTLTITNSVVRNNVATSNADGGGIFSFGTLTITNSTLSGNAAPAGGGIRVDPESTLRLRNSIVVNSTAGGNCSLGGALASDGNNLSDSTACFPGTTQGDIVTSTPLLAPLAVNRPGSTATHALLPGSPAIDGVTFNPTDCGTAITTDQRGVPRPQTHTAARCDIGAFEHDVSPLPTITPLDDRVTAEDTPISAIPFTVGDADTAVSALTVTVTSSNEAVVPNGGLQPAGSGASRSIRVEPAPNRSGTSTIDVAVSDGTATTHETFNVTVNPVNDVPVAADDAFTTSAMQTLTLAPSQGVLANDADVETPPASLTAQLATGPAHGSLTLNPNGGFTYAPAASCSGTDSFTYRASDGNATSSPATVTISVTGSTCAPRASVRVTTAVVGGRLRATIEALPLDGRTNDRLIELRFGAFQNGAVTIDNQAVASGSTYPAPANTTRVELLVARATPGQPTTIPFEAVDLCGAWPSLVGGGTRAGF